MIRVYDKKKEQFVRGEYYVSMNGDLAVVSGFGKGRLKLLPESRYVFQREIGCRDKHGVKIFEGDILQSSTGLTGIVTYLHECAAYVFLEFKVKKWYDLGDEICVQLEIIGNNFTIKDIPLIDDGTPEEYR